MNIELNGAAKRESAIIAKTINMSKTLNNISDSAEFALLQILVYEVDQKEANPQLDPNDTPCLTVFKDIFGLTYLQAGLKIRNKYSDIRNRISEQLIEAYKEIQDLKEIKRA